MRFDKMAKTNNFNSHAHVERDYTRDDIANKLIYFNSHAHVERDLFGWSNDYILNRFQLTRSRGA